MFITLDACDDESPGSTSSSRKPFTEGQGHVTEEKSNNSTPVQSKSKSWGFFLWETTISCSINSKIVNTVRWLMLILVWLLLHPFFNRKRLLLWLLLWSWSARANFKTRLICPIKVLPGLSLHPKPFPKMGKSCVQFWHRLSFQTDMNIRTLLTLPIYKRYAGSTKHFWPLTVFSVRWECNVLRWCVKRSFAVFFGFFFLM